MKKLLLVFSVLLSACVSTPNVSNGKAQLATKPVAEVLTPYFKDAGFSKSQYGARTNKVTSVEFSPPSKDKKISVNVMSMATNMQTAMAVKQYKNYALSSSDKIKIVNSETVSGGYDEALISHKKAGEVESLYAVIPISSSIFIYMLDTGNSFSKEQVSDFHSIVKNIVASSDVISGNLD